MWSVISRRIDRARGYHDAGSRISINFLISALGPVALFARRFDFAWTRRLGGLLLVSSASQSASASLASIHALAVPEIRLHHCACDAMQRELDVASVPLRARAPDDAKATPKDASFKRNAAGASFVTPASSAARDEREHANATHRLASDAVRRMIRARESFRRGRHRRNRRRRRRLRYEQRHFPHSLVTIAPKQKEACMSG